MPFKMTVDRSDLMGKILPQGWYSLQFEGFKPKLSKNKDGINLNGRFTVVNSEGGEYDGTSILITLSTRAPFILQDFVHAFGMPMEGDGDQLAIPGDFDGDQDNPESLRYSGPLLGQVVQAEIIPDEYQGKTNNKIKQFKCAVPNCASTLKVRHSENLIKN